MINYLIFPIQLFYNLDHLDKSYKIYLLEEPRYFIDFKYHKLKLAYHRATMRKYYNFLKKENYNVKYIEYKNITKDFYNNLKNVIFMDPSDYVLENKLKKLLKENLIKIEDTKNFLISNNELSTIKEIIYKNNKYLHDNFYKYQRKKLNILMNNNKPLNNIWTYDTKNRLKIPKDHNVIKIKFLSNKVNYKQEAIEYVNKNFENNYGSLDNFIYPIDEKESKKWLLTFLKTRLLYFGKYQDAVLDNNNFIYHSILTPMMNIGLLTDKYVIKISYEFYLKNKTKIPIESFEGFIRQIIGWRNYVYTIYKLEGLNMKKCNFLNHTNKINEKFWTGETGIFPIDNIINNIIKYSYVHHIERLMYLGNFMLLCFIHPEQVYKIFMEWTIDAYEWVMIPNVFGMSQYACENLMMNRPYFSSSNYILKMSNYKKDKWCIIWDNLYYNFINKHKNIFKSNYAIAQMVKHWNNKNIKEQNEIIKNASIFLKELFK